MSKVVRFDHYGNVDVLKVVEVENPLPSPGRVLLRVVTAGTNPVEIAIWEGQLAQQFPTTFPSGEGTDFAGIVAQLGDGVTSPSVGTAVIV
jgi:NADPH:quinone reductase-like Zn-dependent oxidoreductase